MSIEGSYECLPRARTGHVAPSQSGTNAPLLERVVEGKKLYRVRNQTFEVDEHYQLIKAIGIGAYGLVCSALDLRRVPGSDYYDPRREAEDEKRREQQACHRRRFAEAAAASTKKRVGAEQRPPAVLVPTLQQLPFVPLPLSNNLTSPYVAIKKIGKLFSDLIDGKRVLREVKLLRMLRGHDNILHLHHVLMPRQSRETFKDLYVVTELLDTDLHCVIKSKQTFEPDHLKYLTYQMLKCMIYTHSCGVIHRDLKPANMLLTANCDLKVCDFGLARGGVPLYDPNYFPLAQAAAAAGKASGTPGASGEPKSAAAAGPRTVNATAAGDHLPEPFEVPINESPQATPLELTEYVITRYYRPPELLIMANYSHPVDMWSIGCIFAEMILRRPVFPGKDYLHQMKLICDKEGLIGVPSSGADVERCFKGGEEGQNYLKDLLQRRLGAHARGGHGSGSTAAAAGSSSSGGGSNHSSAPATRGAAAKEALHTLRRSLFGDDSDVSDSAMDLIASLICFDPSKRLTALQALRHPYLASCYAAEDEIARNPTTAEPSDMWEFDQRDLDEDDLRELFWGELVASRADAEAEESALAGSAGRKPGIGAAAATSSAKHDSGGSVASSRK